MILKLFNNKPLFYIFIFFISFLSIAVNIKISGMSVYGAFASLLGILLLIYSFYTSNIIGVVLFFAINSIIGPFSLVNLKDYGYDIIGRIDYFIAIFLLLYYVLKNKKINFFIFWIYSLLLISYYINLNDLVDTKIYGYIGSIAIGYILYLILKNNIDNELNCHEILFKLLVLIYIVNLLFAYSQLFFYGFHIRSDIHIAQTYIFNVLVNRPLGLYGSAYVFSLATLFYSYVILLFVSNKNRKKITKVIFYISFPLIFLSSTAVGTGIVFYYLLLKVKINKRTRLIVLIFMIIGVIMLYTTLNISDFGKSSATKILMWNLILDNVLTKSDIFEILFGHGIDSAKYLSLQIPDFIKNYRYGDISYDHEILEAHMTLLPHNVYMQILYEFGILMFMLFMIPIYRIMVFLSKENNFSMINLIFVASFTNYMFHNGMFSPILIYSILIMLHKVKKN
jgi:hypothetical protein